MKKIFTLISILVLVVSGFAQTNETFDRVRSNVGTLTITSVTKNTARILVDGAVYNTTPGSNVTTINSIKSGYHLIKIYQSKKSAYNNAGQFGKNMQLIYQGNVYVKPRFHVDLVINRFGKAFLDEQQMNAGYDDDEFDGWSNTIQPMNQPSFDQFKEILRKERFDNTKLVLAKQAIASNWLCAAQVKEVAGLFNFESSKLDIAKYSYKYTTDKNNYFILNDAFTFSSSKEELARFIQAAG
jgi:hypothetical protein